jgi:transcriptional regulator with XRE-family HTH domain
MRADEIQTSVGNAIRKKREALKISQEAFADSIRMHRAYYSSIERGERNLTLRILAKVAKGLDVKIMEIFKIAGI